MNPLLKLFEFGQSYWIDNLTRHRVTSGDLKRRVEKQGLRGVTSNSKIFHEAIANAKLAYQYFKQILQSDRWQALEAKGVQVQRMLWASTSTKNPAYRDVMYVEPLIGPHKYPTGRRH